MNKNILSVALAVTVFGALLLPAESSARQIVNRVNADAMNLDRCPYYPSPTVCRLWTMPTTAASATGDLTLARASTDVDRGAIM
jgi:hypothetical protein